ncbi:MAG TPA: hypothetical protein ENK57_03065 [Polyangiaceae bacterium]|nr:hypothetical protein [Polyangiaceae bacterium]
MERRRRNVAWHEAAHATVMRLVGYRPVTATIQPERQGYLGMVTRDWDDKELIATLRTLLDPPPVAARDLVAGLVIKAAVSFAGPVCDALRGVPAINWMATGLSDLESVRYCAGLIGDFLEESIGGVELSIRQAVTHSLRRSWPHVRRVAQTLDRLGDVRRIDLERLLNGIDPHSHESEPIWRCAAGLARRVPASRIIVPPRPSAARVAYLQQMIGDLEARLPEKAPVSATRIVPPSVLQKGDPT